MSFNARGSIKRFGHSVSRKSLYFNIIKHSLSNLFRGRFNGPLNLVIELTNQCNLDCASCYWKRRKLTKTLDYKEWREAIIKIKKKHPSVLIAVWAGGEPMIRTKLIKNLSQNFISNVIMTNGTLPLVPIRNTQYWVSVDGTKEYYERQKGSMYDQVEKNIKLMDDNSVVVTCVLSKINKNCIKEFVEHWVKVKSVRKIVFAFFTPGVDDPNRNLLLSKEEKNVLAKEIIKLAKIYPSYLEETAKFLKVFLDTSPKKFAKYCHESSMVLVLDSLGREVYHHIDGKNKISCGCPDTDCNECGTHFAMKNNYIRQHRIGNLILYAKRWFERRRINKHYIP